MSTALQLVRYDTMVRAITRCYQVDEAQDIVNKAAALKVYARQARNVDAEHKATEVRLRAERRAGELLKELNRGKPGRPSKKGARAAPISPYQDALASAKITTRTAQRYQELAEVPLKTFEGALTDPELKPSTRVIVDAARAPAPPRRASRDADRLHCLCVRLAEEDFGAKDLVALFGVMGKPMQERMAQVVPVLAALFIDSRWAQCGVSTVAPAPDNAPPALPVSATTAFPVSPACTAAAYLQASGG